MNKQFEEWLKANYRHDMYMDYNADFCSYQIFDQLPSSMQKGVYEEFFKEQGIQLSVDLVSIEEAFEILKTKL